MTTSDPLRRRLSTRASDAGTLRPAVLVLVAALVLGAVGVTWATRAAADSPRGVVARYERALAQLPADCAALAELATVAHAAEIEPLCRASGDEPDWAFGWPEGEEWTTRTRVLAQTRDGDTARVELLVVSTSPGSRVEARPAYLLERVDGEWRVAGGG